MISGSERRKRIAVVLGICMPVVVLHFVTGTGYHGPARWFVNGYLIDMLLPFYLYFLAGLALEGKRRLHSWPVRAAAVLAIGACIETLQGFGVPVMGRTFDPMDYAAYAAGALLAVLMDRQLLRRLLPFWETGAAPGCGDGPGATN